MKGYKGRIHSIESFGTVDGPGVRMVIFFQGCPMRCAYCHNPDTWNFSGGDEMKVDEILSLYEKRRSFYLNGGITATGGEPLSQLPFLTELFSEAKRRGIHTALDTSGYPYRKELEKEYEELFKCTDLVMLDIKHSDEAGHIRLTGRSCAPILEFLDALDTASVPTLIRHVVVPSITDREDELKKVGVLLARHSNIVGLDVLAYHDMGKAKYKEMNIPYPLQDVPPLSEDERRRARDIIISSYRAERARRRNTA